MDSIWNVFRRWRKGRVVPDPNRNELPASPVGAGFRPADWVVKQALERVLADTEGLQPLQPALLACCLATVAAPQRDQEQALGQLLLGRDWCWTLLETWSETFAACQQWPLSWQRFPSLIVPHRPAPRDVNSAVPYLSYLEMRDLLRTVWPHRTGMPLKVDDLEAAFVAHIGWEQVAEIARQRHQERVAAALASAARDRASLFCQHLTATADALMAYHQWQQIRPNQFLAYRLRVSCSEEATASVPFRDRFNSGADSDLPPYFPGDGCRLQLVRESPAAPASPPPGE